MKQIKQRGIGGFVTLNTRFELSFFDEYQYSTHLQQQHKILLKN